MNLSQQDNYIINFHHWFQKNKFNEPKWMKNLNQSLLLRYWRKVRNSEERSCVEIHIHGVKFFRVYIPNLGEFSILPPPKLLTLDDLRA